MREGCARAAAVAAAALAACATVGESASAPPASFSGVRTLALVRQVEGRGARSKDPLDGLDETLRARGFTTRVVELGRDRRPDQAPFERLFRDLEARAAAASRAERIAAPVRDLGSDAGKAVAALGVDAVVTYHRLERMRPPPLPAQPLGLPGMGAPSPPPALPVGALLVLDRTGHLATFAWGDAGALDDPGMPLNAAEAIEQVVRALTGADE
jgi:hypothetical protein